MTQKISPSTAALLTIPPILWAGNAIVGRLVHEMVPPVTLNFFRWAIAFLILLPLGYPIFQRGSGLWAGRRRFALLGLLGIGLYNALQYLALQTSSPINVTLVAAGMPIWMLLVGALFFGLKVKRLQIAGALMSNQPGHLTDQRHRGTPISLPTLMLPADTTSANRSL